MVSRFFTSDMSKILQNLDKVFALVGLVVGIILFLAVGDKFPEIGVALSLACVVYLLIQRGSSPTLSSGFEMSRQYYRLSSITFFVLFTYSLLSILLNAQPYVRPLGYFFSTSLLVCLLAVEVIALPLHGRYVHYTLFKIMLVALSVQWTPQLIFPGSLSGIDVWWHRFFVSEILSQGNVPAGYTYSKMPIMHLLAGATSLVTGLSYKLSVISYSSVGCSAILLLVFTIGRRFFDARIALLSALLLGVAGWFTYMGVGGAIPNSLGIVFGVMIIYLLFIRKTPLVAACLRILLAAELIVTHSVASTTTFIVLLFAWLGVELYRLLYGKGERFIPVSMVILFGVGMFSFWMYVSGHIVYVADIIKYSLQMDYMIGQAEAHHYWITIPYSELLLNRSGILLFYCLAVIGILLIISPKLRDMYNFPFVLAGAVLAVIAFAGTALGFWGILSDRWMGPSQILLSIPAGVGVIFICTRVRSRRWTTLLSIILVLPLSFLMITAPISNLDSPIYSPNSAYRESYTESEFVAADTINEIYDGGVLVDSPYSACYRRKEFISVSTSDMADCLFDRDFEERTEAVITRDYWLRRGIFSGWIRVDYNPHLLLEEQGFSKLYDCQTVSVFLPLKPPGD